VVAGVSTTAGIARADPATAEALFREGRRLLDEGNYDVACVKLAESQVQDPASGTLINLALCYEKQGKLASAWAQYRLAAALARSDGRADRVASAEKRAAELEPRVPHLVLRVPVVAPGMEVSWGATHVGAGAFDSPIPLDPGAYVMTAAAPGYRSVSTPLELREGERRVLEVSPLQPLPAPLPPPAAPGRPAVGAEQPPAVVPHARSRTLAYILGGTGIAVLGVGAAFGASSLSAYANAESLCPTHHGCDPGAMEAWRDAQTRAWVANVALGLGLAATAAGVWLWVSPPRAGKGRALQLVPLARGAALSLEGAL
jgi:hypothetical protein